MRKGCSMSWAAPPASFRPARLIRPLCSGASHHLYAASDQRYLSWRRRRHARHAHIMAGLHHQHCPRSLLDQRLGAFPQMGVMGAAVGTATGRGIGVAFQLWILLSGRGRVVVRRQDLKLNVDVMLRLARVSASGVMQFLVSTASWLGLVRIIAVFGAAALAGYAFGERDG